MLEDLWWVVGMVVVYFQMVQQKQFTKREGESKCGKC